MCIHSSACTCMCVHMYMCIWDVHVCTCVYGMYMSETWWASVTNGGELAVPTVVAGGGMFS